ncbi:hypothetical protein COCNU_10G008560 [Cocos nucifera]|uniref:Uncharacterized protein n=1 Tax=Cocos nucifera TaxID=13894 RepID=A0A8K0N8M6_COCNU|nr:hypothetical protein COCNU_10G008560 [Cocos nucifera]
MKLKINKACDLSSISVLPPRSKGMSSGADGSGVGRSQGSQHRSQSQQSFSQGPSLSQLSQSSLEESLMIDQRFGSQEKDNSSKRVSFAPNKSARGESQLQLSRASNNVLRHWNSCSVPDNRCQISDELEHSIRLMEGSINRLGMVLDSVQGDVMQVNRAVKEVSLEMEGIRQKIFLLDSSVQQMLKREDDIKAFLDESLMSIADKLVKTSSSDKLNEIASAFSAVPEKIEAHLLKLREVCRIFTNEMEEKDFRVVIDLDEDNDGVGSYYLVKKEAGSKTAKAAKNKKKNRRRKEQPKDSPITESDKLYKKEVSTLCVVRNEADADIDDELDPAMKEELDRLAMEQKEANSGGKRVSGITGERGVQGGEGDHLEWRAIEPWVLDFVPRMDLITKTIIWLCLPSLSMEFQCSKRIWGIMEAAGKLGSIDNFMEQLQKTGFVQIKVEINSSKPLKSSVLIKGKKKNVLAAFHLQEPSGDLLLVWKDQPRGRCM